MKATPALNAQSGHGHDVSQYAVKAPTPAAKHRTRDCAYTGAKCLDRLRRLTAQASTAANDVHHERGDRDADHVRVRAYAVGIGATDVAGDDNGSDYRPKYDASHFVVGHVTSFDGRTP